MIIHFDYDKLRGLLRDFYELTNTSVCIFDTDYYPILAYPKEPPKLCSIIKSTIKGNMGCIRSDIEGCKKSRDAMGIVTYECHAGLRDTVTPIVYNGMILGYMMFGQITDNSLSKDRIVKRIIERCSNYGLTEDEITNAFNEINMCDEDKINAAANIMLACASYIYLSKYAKIESLDLINEISEYMKNNLQKGFNIDEICNKYFLSRNKLFKLFREKLNMTPMSYLTTLRINKAKDLLSKTNASVSSVSDSVGISDYNYFIKIFKKEVGLTPLKYRKNYKF